MSLVRKNFFFLFIGNLVYTVCQWGMLVVYAKMGSPEVVGQFSLASAIISPVLMFTNLQLRALQATDATNKYLLDDFMAVRVISLGVFLIVATFVGIVFYQGKGILSVLTVVIVAKGVEALNDVLYGYFQKHERMRLIATSMVIKGVLSLVVLAGTFFFSKSLTISLWALTLVWLGRMLFFDFQWLSQFESGRYSYQGASEFCDRIVKACVERRAMLLEIFKNGAYLGVVMGLISLNTNAPRYIVDRLLGQRELGFFSAMVYASAAINIFVMSVGSASSPRLARYFVEGDTIKFLKVLFRNIVVVLFCGVMGLLVVCFFGPQLLTIAYTKEYATYNSVFFLVVLSAIVSALASMFGFALTAIKSYIAQVPIFVAVLVFNIMLCSFLTPSFGLRGVAWSMVGSYLFQGILSAFVLFRNIKRPQDTGRKGMRSDQMWLRGV